LCNWEGGVAHNGKKGLHRHLLLPRGRIAKNENTKSICPSRRKRGPHTKTETQTPRKSLNAAGEEEKLGGPTKARKITKQTTGGRNAESQAGAHLRYCLKKAKKTGGKKKKRVPKGVTRRPQRE